MRARTGEEELTWEDFEKQAKAREKARESKGGWVETSQRVNEGCHVLAMRGWKKVCEVEESGRAGCVEEVCGAMCESKGGRMGLFDWVRGYSR